MTNASKLPPRQPGYYIFKGIRIITDSQYESMHEPVEVCEVKIKQETTLGVGMIGRQQKFRMERFVGVWERMNLEAA